YKRQILNRTLFSIVESREVVQRIVENTEKVVGPLADPNTGILAVLPVLERVLGEDIVLGSMNCRIVRPGDPDQLLHSDIPAVHRRITGNPVMLQVVWMIDGFSAEKGATRIVPGSHRHPEAYPPEQRTIPLVMQPEAPAGSAMIFNGQCWHGGGANRSQQRRRAVFGHYRIGAWMRFQTDPALFITQEVWQTMNPRQRALFRMEHGISQKNAADYYADQMRSKRYD
ncbi:MAG: phytanoyl-CoA dioxygenase family protein, partial [Novosphingobium sp.]|nr:phytanoyl-CoA dioxygenase family protein [Novosphingobium sp.]